MAGVIVISPLLARAQVSAPVPVPAADPVVDAGEAHPWWRQITTDGYASLSYSYNQNQPEPRLNQFRVFDFNDNDPQLDVAELVVQRAIAEPNQFGFRLDLFAGSGVPEITAAYGLFRDTHTGIAHHFDIPQLFVSYIAPIGKGLRFDVGKFVSDMGYEVIGGYDGYNDNFSRGYTFGYGLPFTNTGVKATYAFDRRITGTLLACNGWDNVQRLNHGYTFGAQLALATSKTTSISFNFIRGPERPRDSKDQRNVGEIVATWKPHSRVTFALDGLYGHEENGVAPGYDAIWKGLAGYAKYHLTKRFSLAFRGEIFGDGGGTRTGTNQTLQGYTLTPEYDLAAKFSKLNSHFKKADGKFVIRGEFRQDLSDRKVFLVGAIPRTDQQFTSSKLDLPVLISGTPGCQFAKDQRLRPNHLVSRYLPHRVSLMPAQLDIEPDHRPINIDPIILNAPGRILGCRPVLG